MCGHESIIANDPGRGWADLPTPDRVTVCDFDGMDMTVIRTEIGNTFVGSGCEPNRRLAEVLPVQQTALEIIAGDVIVSGLNEEMQGKWTGAKAGVMEAIAGFAPIQNALGEFMKTWSEKSEVLSGLQSGLEAGQLDPAAVSQIPALQELVTGAGEKLTEWQGSFTEQNATATSALEQMKSVYDMIAGSN